MRLDGRRGSGNVSDRRRSGGAKAGLGVGGLLIVGIITWLMGGNPLDVLTTQLSGAGQSGADYVPTAREEEMARFASQILAATEDVWTAEFEKMGRRYDPPQMVLFTGATTSGCGGASSQTGPFYCPNDQTVYIDLSFFDQMQNELGAGGDFAYAYVIAHEVGHHVQFLLDTLGEVHELQNRVSERDGNRLQVRVELQADFYAGLWAYHDNQNFGSLEDGDIEEGLNAATAIGDDRLQMEAQGYTVPDAFNHGTSEQRMRWLKRGVTGGRINDGDTFSPAYEAL